MPLPLGAILAGGSNLGGGGALGGILKGVLGALGPIGAGIGAASSIASLFRKSPQGIQKERETEVQQGTEQAAADIQRKVASGEMDTDSALTQLQMLLQQAGSGYGDRLSSIAITNAINDIQGRRNIATSAGGDIRGSQQFQKDTLATRLRNRLAGTGLGDQLEGSPLANILQPRNPLANLDQIKQIVGGFRPPSQTEGFSALGERLKSRLK